VTGQERREEEPEDLDEQELEEEDVEEDENDAGNGEMPGWLRTLGIVLVFLIVGPPLGGYTLLAIIFVMGVIDHGINWARLSEAFAGAVFFTAVFSYVFGGILAILTGVMVAVSRIVGGHTTILTPVFASVVANGAAALVNSMIATKSVQPSLPGQLPLTAGLLPASMFAAILCWRLAKWWRLA
jgi:hypothetical protein